MFLHALHVRRHDVARLRRHRELLEDQAPRPVAAARPQFSTPFAWAMNIPGPDTWKVLPFSPETRQGPGRPRRAGAAGEAGARCFTGAAGSHRVGDGAGSWHGWSCSTP